MEEYVQSIRVNDDERMKLKYPKEPPKVHLYQGGLRETLMLEEKEWKTFNCHDPHIFKDEQTGCYYVYSTDLGKPGIHIRKSPDLIHWDYLGTGFEKGVPEEANKWSQAQGLWAPDIIKVGDEYRIYYSASTFGSQQSCIGLAVAKHPEGPFEHKGLVIKTTNEAPVNAIDANLVVDHKTGEQYMVYGSFWGGIRIIKLDSTTGLTAEDGFGIPLATRPREMVDTAVEGAYIRYNKQTGYYYLFVSYGSLASDYHVRVGRSKCITGPYVDYHNVEMTTINDKPNDIGLKIT
ncbi:MAG: arabinan endo-1,5-alpha-L-arabinosidase, partial [Turicibacter sp.]|nr:arabinan endo-1,5-alpha-L-arabinosidase [Turicibacter sp.]